YDSNSVSSSMGTRSIVNEPLVEFDELDPTAAGTHPWLATAFQFANGGKDIQLTIRQNVKFNDGSSFGPADVAATYKVVANPKANVFGVPDQASDPTVSNNTVTLHFKTPQYTSLFTILGKTYVLKASVATQVAANPTMAINAAASDALVSGQLDWAGNDIPNVYENYVNLNPQTNHAWFASGSTVTLYFNLNAGNGGATGIGEAAVRKAISYGIDRNALALLGESGYERAASSSSALILPNQKAFLPSDGSLANDLSTAGNAPDPATATAQKLPAGM